MVRALDDAAALVVAHRVLEASVRHLTESTTSLPSPCDGWSAGDVAQHVVGGAVRYRMLLEGAAAEDLAPTRTADHLGSDALAAAVRTDLALIEAFSRPGVLETVVHHPAGDITGQRLLVMRVFEAALHGWDVACAVGADDHIDPGLCTWMLERIEEIEELRAAGYYGHSSEVEGDPQTRLLAAAGRLGD